VPRLFELPTALLEYLDILLLLLLILYNTEVLMVFQHLVLAAKLKVKYLITKLIRISYPYIIARSS